MKKSIQCHPCYLYIRDVDVATKQKKTFHKRLFEVYEVKREVTYIQSF